MINKFKPKSEFSRNVLTLMTGTTIAQVIPILISPIITRIYTPEDFGLLALYMSGLMIFGNIVAGKYEQAILISHDMYTNNLVIFSIILSFVSSCFLFFIILLFNEQIINLINYDIGIWLYFLPLNIFIISVTTIIYNWHNRNKNYKTLSSLQIIRSVSQSFIQILLGFAYKTTAGLIVGTIFGSIISLWYSIYKIRDLFNNVSYNRLRFLVLIKKYNKFPKFMVLSTLMENMSAQLPIILISSFFGASLLGFFALSQRVVRIPIGFIGSSIGHVFREEASCNFMRHGTCRVIFVETFKKLVFISTIPFIFFYFVAPDLFAFVFGDKWRVAGEYAQIMTVLFYLQFITSPLSCMFSIAEKQQYDFWMQVYLLAGVVCSFYIGYSYYNNLNIALYLFVFIYSLKYLYELIMSYKFTIKD